MGSAAAASKGRNAAAQDAIEDLKAYEESFTSSKNARKIQIRNFAKLLDNRRRNFSFLRSAVSPVFRYFLKV